MKKINLDVEDLTESTNDTECSCGKEICDGTCSNCKKGYNECTCDCEETKKPENPAITHVVVLKSETVLYCYRTMELLRNLPNGEITIILVCDVLDHPADGDRGIITVEMDNVDYIHEWYHEDAWNQLVEMVMRNHIEEDDDENPLLYG